MKQFSLTPLVGVGEIRFGMKRDDVRLFLGQWAAHPSWPHVDCYYDGYLQVSFDKLGELEFIQVSRGDDIKVTWKDLDIFAKSAEDVVENVKKVYSIDTEDREYGYSFVLPEIEMAFWRPTKPEGPLDEEGKYFSTVGIGRKGYYTNSR